MVVKIQSKPTVLPRFVKVRGILSPRPWYNHQWILGRALLLDSLKKGTINSFRIWGTKVHYKFEHETVLEMNPMSIEIPMHSKILSLKITQNLLKMIYKENKINIRLKGLSFFFKELFLNTGPDGTLVSDWYPWAGEGKPSVFHKHSSKILENQQQNQGLKKQARLLLLPHSHCIILGLSLLICKMRALNWLVEGLPGLKLYTSMIHLFLQFSWRGPSSLMKIYAVHFVEKACFWKIYHNTKFKDY